MSGPLVREPISGPVRTVINPFLLPPVPWRNGGGITREIAVSPSGAGYTDFDWRLSIADIVQSGPFSSLPGVDRHFLMATEGSLRMIIDGRSRQLKRGSDAAFTGEAEVSVEVLKGPTRNLNLMTRRGVCRGSIGVGHVDGPVLAGAGRGPAAVVLLSGTARLEDGTELKPFHALLPGRGEEQIHCRDALVATVCVWTGPQA